MRIGCVVMAAGNAVRFGENKLAVLFAGKPLIRHALEAVPRELETVVVTQYPEVEAMAAEFGFACLKNIHPDWGISHTIRLGTELLSHCDGILYLVSDQPLLQKDSVQLVVEAWKSHPDRIVGAAHEGKRGNPNLFPRRFFPELMELQEDCGGNGVIRRHGADLVLVEIPKAQLSDVDTPAALQKLHQER